ncbi:MAG: hypothetical protein AAFZ92_03460 [Pseudomonadota bacterium]
MIRALLAFYLRLLCDALSGQTMPSGLLMVDEEHSHYRRFTKRYKRKQSLVKNYWIGAGLIGLMFPVLHVLIVLSLATTFVSFSILDETE